MTSLRDYLADIFLADLRGQVFTVNALHGTEIGLHTADVIKLLMAEAFKAAEQEHPYGCDCEQFFRLMDDLSLETHPLSKEISGQANAGHGSDCEGDLFVILPAPIIPALSTKNDIDRFENQTGLKATIAPLQWMYDLEPSQRYFSLNGKIGNSWIWFTHETSVGMPSEIHNSADYFRDVLGLIHRRSAPVGVPDNHLCLLKFPKSIAPTNGLRA